MCTVRIEVQSPELCVNYNYSCCLAFLRSFLTQIPWQPKCRQLIGKKKVKSPAPEVYDMLIKKSARRCNNPFGNHWVAQQIAGWLTSWLVLIMTNREPVLLFFFVFVILIRFVWLGDYYSILNPLGKQEKLCRANLKFSFSISVSRYFKPD